jgi:hypothetical protein
MRWEREGKMIVEKIFVRQRVFYPASNAKVAVAINVVEIVLRALQFDRLSTTRFPLILGWLNGLNH